MTYNQIVQKVADELKLPTNIVRDTYKAYWQFIRNFVENLPLKEDLNEQEFNQLKTNFNIPSLGKLCCTIDRYRGVKKKFQYIKNLREKHGKC